MLRPMRGVVDTYGMYTVFQVTVKSLTRIYNLNMMHIPKWYVFFPSCIFTFTPLSQKINRLFHMVQATMPQNAFLNYRVSWEEGCAHFKLKAKQIGAELLRRIISVCLWMSTRDGCSIPQHSVSVYFTNGTPSLVWVNSWVSEYWCDNNIPWCCSL